MHYIRAPPTCWCIHTRSERIPCNDERAAYPGRCAALFVFSRMGEKVKSTNMIPDNTFIFKQYVVPRNFDDHAVRLHQLLQQDAMPTLESSGHLLAVCPVCKHPWYKVGRQEYPRLTLEQLAFVGAILNVETHALHLLPRSLCPICSAVYLGGMFSVEGFPQRKGYRFQWESASPSRNRLMALVCRSEGCTFDELVHLSLEPLAESTRDMHSVLAWLEMCPSSETIRAYPNDQCQQFAWRYPPRYLVDGNEHQWRGYAWNAMCPPLKGEVQVTLVGADDSPALAPLSSLLLSWSILVRTLRLAL